MIDLVLPSESEELLYISKKISEKIKTPVNTYIKILPEPDVRGNILIIVSDKLLPLLDNNNYLAKFSLYVNSVTFEGKKNKTSSALYSDQPIHRQISLISEIFGDGIRLAIPYENPKYNEILAKGKENFPLINFNIIKTNNKNKLKTINKAIQSNEVILAISEKSLYNSQTIRSILLSSYRHKTAVIGPNEGFVKAGALASVVTSSDQYINEIIEMVELYIDTKEIPKPRHPTNFKVKINRNVADSLGIEIPPEEQLRLKIKDD